MGRRIGYGLLGVAAGLPVYELTAFLIKHQFASPQGTVIFATALFNFGILVAQWSGRLPRSLTEMERPITLFPQGIPGREDS